MPSFDVTGFIPSPAGPLSPASPRFFSALGGSLVKIGEAEVAQQISRIRIAKQVLGGTPMDINGCMNKFLLSSRELFNHFFLRTDLTRNLDSAWHQHDLFCRVERVLFETLVVDPLELQARPYGELQDNLAVLPNGSFELPIMLNRDLDGGYWDHPVSRCPPSVTLRFICFFDWSAIDRRDHRYARVRVVDWPGMPELVGKDGLVETHHIRYRVTNEQID